MSGSKAAHSCKARMRGRRFALGVMALLLVPMAAPQRSSKAAETAPEGQLGSARTAVPIGPALAVQGGFSGLAPTVEAEISTRFGLVLGAGVHAGQSIPPGPTARLAFEHGFGGRIRLRVGARLYPFDESGTSFSCHCAFLVPEISLRFVGTSGLVFEFGEPIARVNLSRVSSEGWGKAMSFDGENAFLFSILLGGVVHQF